MTGWEGTRGGRAYKQPPHGWERKGLKVKGIYDNGNDDWLGIDKKSWPVAYHGFRNPAFVLPKVIKGNY